MNSATNKILRFLILPAVIAAGCAGGGTSGTGGGSFSVAGTLRTGSNTPVAGVKVAALPVSGPASARTGADSKANTEDVTDSQGQFALELDQRPDAINLKFNGDNFESNVAVTSIPATAVGVTLDLSLDTETGEVNEESEQFEESSEAESSAADESVQSEAGEGGGIENGSGSQSAEHDSSSSSTDGSQEDQNETEDSSSSSGDDHSGNR